MLYKRTRKILASCLLSLVSLLNFNGIYYKTACKWPHALKELLPQNGMNLNILYPLSSFSLGYRRPYKYIVSLRRSACICIPHSFEVCRQTPPFLIEKKKWWRKEVGGEQKSGSRARKVAVTGRRARVHAIGVLHAALRYWEIIVWRGRRGRSVRRSVCPRFGGLDFLLLTLSIGRLIVLRMTIDHPFWPHSLSVFFFSNLLSFFFS